MINQSLFETRKTCGVINGSQSLTSNVFEDEIVKALESGRGNVTVLRSAAAFRPEAERVAFHKTDPTTRWKEIQRGEDTRTSRCIQPQTGVCCKEIK